VDFDSNPCDGGGGGGNIDSTSSGTTNPKTDTSGQNTGGLGATGVDRFLTVGAASVAALLVLMGVTLMVARRCKKKRGGHLLEQVPDRATFCATQIPLCHGNWLLETVQNPWI